MGENIAKAIKPLSSPIKNQVESFANMARSLSSVNVKLDTSGRSLIAFRRQADDVTKSVSTMRSTLQSGEGLIETKEFTKAKKALSDIEYKIESLYGTTLAKAKIEYGNLFDILAKRGNFDNLGVVIEMTDNMRRRFETLNKKAEETRASIVDMMASGKAYKTPEDNTEEKRLETQKSLQKEYGKTQSALDKLLERQKKLEAVDTSKSSASFRSLRYEMAETGKELLSIGRDLSEVYGTKIEKTRAEMAKIANVELPTKEYQTAYNALVHYTSEVTRLKNEQADMLSRGVSKVEWEWQNNARAIGEAEKQVEKYKDVIDELQKSGKARVLGSETDEYRAMSAVVNGYKAARDTLKAEMSRTASTLVSTADESTAAAVSNLISQVTKAAQKGVATFESNATPLRGSFERIAQEGQSSTFKLSEQQKEYQKSVYRTISALNSLYQKLQEKNTSGVDKMSDAYKSLETKAASSMRTVKDETQKLVDSLKADEARIRSAMSEIGKQSIPTDKYKETQNVLSELTVRSMEFKKSISDINTGAVKATKEELANVERQALITDIAIQKIIASLNDMESRGTAFTPGADTNLYSNYQAQLGEVSHLITQVELDVSESTRRMSAEMVSRTEDAVTEIGNSVPGIAQKIIGAVSSVGSSMKKHVHGNVKSISSLVGGTLKAGIKNMGTLAKSITKVGKESKSTTNLTKKLTRSLTSMFTLLKGRIRRTAISAVFNDMKANIGVVATVSSRFNDAISRMIDSSKALGAQIIASFEPLVAVLGPVLAEFIDRLTAASDAMAQFFARLTGNTMYLRAIKGQSDYAASIDATANSTKKATKAAKEYENTVLSFDRLHILNGKGEGIGIDTPDIEKANTQATALNTIADKIHDAMTKHQWRKAGAAMADGVNLAFDWLKNAAGWEKNGKKITETLKAITEGIEGFLMYLKPREIGGAIGDVANTIIESLKVLTDPEDGLNFGLLGFRIGEVMAASFKKIEWRDMGTAIMNGMQGMLTSIYAFLVSGAPGELGKGFSEMISGLIDSFSPDIWGNVISELVNSFSDFVVNAFGDRQKFEVLGEKLAEAINVAVDGVDADKVSGAVNALSGAITGFVTAAVNKTDWGAVGSKLAEIGKKINWGDVFGSIAIFAAPFLVSKTSSIFLAAIKGLGASLLAPVGGVFHTLFVGVGTYVAAAIGGWEIGKWLGDKIPKAITDIGMSNVKSSFSSAEKMANNPLYKMAHGDEDAEQLARIRSIYETQLSGYTDSIDTVYGAMLKSAEDSEYSWEIVAGKWKIANGQLIDMALEAQSSWVSTADAVRNGLQYTLDEAGHIIEYNAETMGTKLVDGVDVATNNVIFTADQARSMLESSAQTTSDGFSSIASDIAATGKTIQDTNGSIHSANTSMLSLSSKLMNLVTSIPSKLSSLFGGGASTANKWDTVMHYANGGIVGDGQLFWANEGGKAELIGNDGRGNTAVVNNEQIISAVVTGVQRAVTSAGMAIADRVASQMQSGDGGDIVLQIGDEEVARASMRGQRKIDKRYNSTSVSFG